MAGGNLGHAMQFKLKGDILAFKVKTAVRIYRGSLVAVDATGYALPASDTAGQVFVGIAEEEANNTSGASGDITVRVRRKGLAVLKKGAATAITDIGQLAYANAAHTSSVDGTVDLAATTTNDVRIGRILDRLEDTPGSGTYTKKYLLVDIDPV